MEKKVEKVEIKIGIYDKDSKICSAKLVIKNEKKPAKDKWYNLTGKSGQNAEVRIRYSVGTPVRICQHYVFHIIFTNTINVLSTFSDPIVVKFLFKTK